MRCRHTGQGPRRRRRHRAGRDAHHRAAQEGFDAARRARAVTEAMAAFRDFRPDVVLLDLMLPGQGRHRRLPGDPRRVRRADRHADRQERHRRRRGRAGVRRRRLRRQAVQAQGAGRPDPGPAAPSSTEPRRSTLDHRRPHHRRGRAHGHARRRADRRSPRWSSTCWSAWPASRGRCSPARCCSSRCGATGTPPTPGWSTCTSSGCAPRSSTTRRTPRSC